MSRLLALCLAAPLIVSLATIAAGSTDPKPVAIAAIGSVVGWVTVTLIPAKVSGPVAALGLSVAVLVATTWIACLVTVLR